MAAGSTGAGADEDAGLPPIGWAFLEAERANALHPAAPEPAVPEQTAAATVEPEPDLAPDTATSTLPAPQVRPGSAWRRGRLAFQRWRRTRPFWGAVLVILGGSEILFTEKAPFKVVVHFGLYGLAGLLLPAILVLCGVLTLANPQQRTFYSVLSVLLALGTWLTSNLGGFLLGMLLGIAGGSLAFGWMPGERPPRRALFGHRRVHSDQVP